MVMLVYLSWGLACFFVCHVSHAILPPAINSMLETSALDQTLLSHLQRNNHGLWQLPTRRFVLQADNVNRTGSIS